jgi:hypothetical protein
VPAVDALRGVAFGARSTSERPPHDVLDARVAPRSGRNEMGTSGVPRKDTRRSSRASAPSPVAGQTVPSAALECRPVPAPGVTHNEGVPGSSPGVGSSKARSDGGFFVPGAVSLAPTRRGGQRIGQSPAQTGRDSSLAGLSAGDHLRRVEHDPALVRHKSALLVEACPDSATLSELLPDPPGGLAPLTVAPGRPDHARGRRDDYAHVPRLTHGPVAPWRASRVNPGFTKKNPSSL